MKSKATCDRCGFYFDINHLYKRKDGKSYCGICRVRIEKTPPESKSISQKDIDRIIEALLKVPPPPKENKKKKSKSKSSLKARRNNSF